MNISDLNNDAKIALVQSGVEQLIERNKQLQQQNDELRKALGVVLKLSHPETMKHAAREALSNNPKL